MLERILLIFKSFPFQILVLFNARIPTQKWCLRVQRIVVIDEEKKQEKPRKKTSPTRKRIFFLVFVIHVSSEPQLRWHRISKWTSQNNNLYYFYVTYTESILYTHTAFRIKKSTEINAIAWGKHICAMCRRSNELYTTNSLPHIRAFTLLPNENHRFAIEYMLFM